MRWRALKRASRTSPGADVMYESQRKQLTCRATRELRIRGHEAATNLLSCSRTLRVAQHAESRSVAPIEHFRACLIASMSRPEQQQQQQEAEVTEGGRGWMVALGMAIIFISTTGHYTAFGLLFKDFLAKVDASTTGATIIMNSLTAAVNFTGLVANILLRFLSYRMMCLIGGLLFSVGLLLTTVADSLLHVVIAYSIIAGIGLGLVAPASYLAFNLYFNEKREVAMVIVQAAMGIGFIIAPHFCQYLLEKYGFRGTMLVLGGIALNSLVGAMLFRPVSPNEVDAKADEEDEESENSSSDCAGDISMTVIPEEEGGNIGKGMSVNENSTFSDVSQKTSKDTIYKSHIVISRKGSFTVPSLNCKNRICTSDAESQSSTINIVKGKEDTNNFKKHPISPNYSSNLLMFDNSITRQRDKCFLAYQRTNLPSMKRTDYETRHTFLMQTQEDEETYEEELPESSKRRTFCQCLFKTFALFFDWSLLTDLVFLNIVLGLSVSFVSDGNFFAMLPFYMVSKGFSGSEIALCLSIDAGSDVLSRLILPFITSALKMKPRTTYLLACLFSAITRSIYVSVDGNITTLAVMSGFLGFFKAGMVVNISLSISQYCSIEKFSGAYSIYMVFTGILTLAVGSFVGMLGFPFCIHALSMGLAWCTVTWLLEYAIQGHCTSPCSP